MQENRKPQLSKESHRFLAGDIAIRALGAIAIWYHTALSGHGIFFIYEEHLWEPRAPVATTLSHGGNRGSNPLGSAIFFNQLGILIHSRN